MKIDPIVVLSVAIILISTFFSNVASITSSGFLGGTPDALAQERVRADNYMQKYNLSSFAWYLALAGYLVLLSYWLYGKRKKA